jgi:hypothetical protein
VCAPSHRRPRTPLRRHRAGSRPGCDPGAQRSSPLRNRTSDCRPCARCCRSRNGRGCSRQCAGCGCGHHRRPHGFCGTLARVVHLGFRMAPGRHRVGSTAGPRLRGRILRMASAQAPCGTGAARIVAPRAISWAGGHDVRQPCVHRVAGWRPSVVLGRRRRGWRGSRVGRDSHRRSSHALGALGSVVALGRSRPAGPRDHWRVLRCRLA